MNIQKWNKEVLNNLSGNLGEPLTNPRPGVTREILDFSYDLTFKRRSFANLSKPGKSWYSVEHGSILTEKLQLCCLSFVCVSLFY